LRGDVDVQAINVVWDWCVDVPSDDFST
jgi:hypothetical protein